MHGDPDENLINNGGQLIFGVKLFFSKLQGITKILNFLWFFKKKEYMPIIAFFFGTKLNQTPKKAHLPLLISKFDILPTINLSLPF